MNRLSQLHFKQDRSSGTGINPPLLPTVLIITAIALLLGGCATHEGYDVTDGVVEPYGFFSGIWHGFILPLSICGMAVVNIIQFWVIVGVNAWTFIQNHLHGTTLRYEHLAEFTDFGIKLVGQPNTELGYYIGYLLGVSEWLGGGGYAARRSGYQ